MHQNTNRLKQRTDYTRTVRPRAHSLRASSIDGITRTPSLVKELPSAVPEPAKLSLKESAATRPVPITAVLPADLPEAQKPKAQNQDSTSISMRLSLPTLRRPPDSGDIPKHLGKRLAIIALAITFFIIGYHGLWNILHKTPAANSAISTRAT